MESKKLQLPLSVLRSLLVCVFTFMAVFGLFEIDSGYAKARVKCDACKKTAYAAYKAANFEARDDYYIAVGNCYNLSDPDEQMECFKAAKEELQSAKEDAFDQLDARREICMELGKGPYDPELLPADFVDPDDIGGDVAANPYFPLIAGTVWVYQGETDEGTETITVTVMDETKEIEYPAESGQVFVCRVVKDVVELDGDVIEDTDDWYAQDVEGNVWYFGEISKEFEDGELVGIEGSWKSGVEGAKPGIAMFADPVEGTLYRQEFFLGDAEDMGEVVSVGEASVTVPFGSFAVDVLQTRDFTPIEPDAMEYKYYAPGVGFVLEVNPETGEQIGLISKSTLP